MANQEHIEWLLEGVDNWNQRRKEEDFEPDLSGADIYWEFEEAGMLDNDDFIPLSNIDLRMANLCGAIFSRSLLDAGADLRHANLWFANLKNAFLPNSRLNGANLQGTVLDGANLVDVKLCDAKISNARLYRTTLFLADLTNANLQSTDLKNANLSSATLHGADLSSTNLIGTDLESSLPWKAKLYRNNSSMSSSYKYEECDKQIICVADLIEQCNKLDTNRSDAVVYFRGEHFNEWELRPSVMRCSESGDLPFRSKESNMLLDLMSRRPDDFTNITSALDQWVLAQHHGLKTRLLDVTRNPLVALFSACDKKKKSGRLHVFAVPKELIKPFNSDTISIVANFCKLSRAEQNLLLGWSEDDIEEREPYPVFLSGYRNALNRLYHLIRQEKPNFKKLIDPRDFFSLFIVEPQQSFERIRAQSGAFLLSAFHERFEQHEVLQWNSGIPIYHHFMIEVPKERKQHIIDELRLLNITRETLFPSLDESAKAITDRYLEELGA